MPEEKWKTDPQVMAGLKGDVTKMPRHLRENSRIKVGGRILSWDDIIEEVETGSTDFGRRYYKAILAGYRKDQ